MNNHQQNGINPYTLILAYSMIKSIVYLAKNKEPKDLTHDELDKIKKLKNSPGFLDEHPDIEEEVNDLLDGITPEKGRNHVKEDQDYLRGLNNKINHLDNVYNKRTPNAQEKIDEAKGKAEPVVEKLREHLGELNDV